MEFSGVAGGLLTRAGAHSDGRGVGGGGGEVLRGPGEDGGAGHGPRDIPAGVGVRLHRVHLPPEVTVIIEHKAYHLGKIMDIRKVLGDWK